MIDLYKQMYKIKGINATFACNFVKLERIYDF